MAQYIDFSSGFNISTASAIDKKLILTKAEMKAISPENPRVTPPLYLVPDIYFALCPDDNKVYVYVKPKTAEQKAEWKREDTGYYRPLEEFLDFKSEEAKETFDQAIQESPTITNIEQIINGSEEEKGLTEKVAEIEETLNTIKFDGGDV